MRRTWLIAALAGLVAASPAGARAAERTLSAVDFLVDGASLVDSAVRVVRCNLANANSTALSCYAFPDGNARTRVGVVAIDGASLRREDLRRALQQCFDAGTKPECWVSASGTAFLRFPDDKVASLRDASLEWVRP